MKDSANDTPRAIAELIAQLGRITQGEASAENPAPLTPAHPMSAPLTPAQWTVLRFFARANRFSRTVSAFAEYHATTRGTASQTIKSLVATGYLVRTRSVEDGRSARLDLTDTARACLGSDPLLALSRAAGDLSPQSRRGLAASLRQMLGDIAREKCRRPFGLCSACDHLLKGETCCAGEEQSYTCNLRNEVLDKAELGLICFDFVAGKGPSAPLPLSGLSS